MCVGMCAFMNPYVCAYVHCEYMCVRQCALMCVCSFPSVFVCCVGLGSGGPDDCAFAVYACVVCGCCVSCVLCSNLRKKKTALITPNPVKVTGCDE